VSQWITSYQPLVQLIEQEIIASKQTNNNNINSTTTNTNNNLTS
jgi:hypothetical protein